jgi:hypothetical protein
MVAIKVLLGIPISPSNDKTVLMTRSALPVGSMAAAIATIGD